MEAGRLGGREGDSGKRKEGDVHWSPYKTITAVDGKGKEAISLEVQKPEFYSLLDIQYRPGGGARKMGR